MWTRRGSAGESMGRCPDRRAVITDMLAMAVAGTVVPLVGWTFSLTDAAAARGDRRPVRKILLVT
jgi:hypothetical protein